MDLSKLEKSDYDLIKCFIKRAEEIESLYTRLCSLEINNKKDSADYKNKMEELKRAIDLEEKQYNFANLTYSKCIVIANYILNNLFSSHCASNVESIIEQEHYEGTIRRVISNLTQKMNYLNKDIDNLIPKNIKLLLKCLGIQEPQKIFKKIDKEEELQLVLDTDYMNIFLTILEGYIKDKKCEEYKDMLIKSKYYTIFINKSIENNIIENNLDMINPLYISSRLFADLMKVKTDIYNGIKNNFGFQVAMSNIYMLTEMKDIDYNYPESKAEAILLQSFLRSAFIFMNDNYISDVNDLFHELIESDEYLKDHFDDNISEENIIKCFKLINRDREKTRILSLNPKYK